MAKPLELIKVEDLTTCDSTAQMITKARNDGAVLDFDRLVKNQPVVNIAQWALAG